MMRQLRTAVIAFLVLTVLTGLAYPLVVTGIAQLAFDHKANGSLIEGDGMTVGSSLIAQQFTAARYFHPRLSAAGNGYDAMASGASNFGPTNPELLESVKAAARAYRRENGLAADAFVPIDAVTSSGSGLDPQISVANARLQAPRVARARDLTVACVRRLIAENTRGRSLGFLGEPGVNVLELNLALDGLDR